MERRLNDDLLDFTDLHSSHTVTLIRIIPPNFIFLLHEFSPHTVDLTVPANAKNTVVEEVFRALNYVTDGKKWLNLSIKSSIYRFSGGMRPETRPLSVSCGSRTSQWMQRQLPSEHISAWVLRHHL